MNVDSWWYDANMLIITWTYQYDIGEQCMSIFDCYGLKHTNVARNYSKSFKI